MINQIQKYLINLGSVKFSFLNSSYQYEIIILDTSGSVDGTIGHEPFPDTQKDLGFKPMSGTEPKPYESSREPRKYGAEIPLRVLR